MQEYFCAVENYTEKIEVSKCVFYHKRKLGVAMHFSEIIKLQFKELFCHSVFLLLVFFF